MEKLHCLSYCLWMTDKINTKGHKECQRHEYKQNSQYLWNIIILLQKKHLSFSEACLQMNTTILIKLTKRNIQFYKINLFFGLWNPMTTRFITQTLIYIISMEFLSVSSRRSSSWKHPQWRGVRRNGCFCRLHFILCTERNSTQNEAPPSNVCVKMLVSITRESTLQFFLHTWAELFEGQLALNPGLKLTRVSFSCIQKHFLG